MLDLLMSQTTKENKRLNTYGDILIDLLHKSEPNYILNQLSVQFDDLQEAISNIDVAILNCFGRNELLVTLIPFLNEVSFMIASFIGRVMELEELL